MTLLIRRRVYVNFDQSYIGIATVDSQYATPGTNVDMEITVNFRRRRVPTRVVQLPHFRPDRLRA